MSDSTAVWPVKVGDTLPNIAAKVYGDPRLWRLIADANDIDNPLWFPRQKDWRRVLVVPRQRT